LALGMDGDKKSFAGRGKNMRRNEK